MAFVQSVIEEGIEPANRFPSGPYPKDKVTYLNDQVVEYQTPSHSEGLGTVSRLQPNGDPIYGVAILQEKTPDLLTVRLPPDKHDLAARIIQQIEQDNVPRK